MSSNILEKVDHSGLNVIKHLGDTVSGLEKNQVIRTYQEMTRIWAGSSKEMWWRWISGTVEALGVKSHIFDCTPQEAADLALQGVTLVTYQHQDDNSWIVFRSNSGKLYETRFTNDEVTEKRVNRTLLNNILKSRSPQEDQVLRLVVIENSPGDFHSQDRKSVV